MWQYNDEMYHHGVKGMKWGVRRDRSKGGSVDLKTAKKKTEAAGTIVRETSNVRGHVNKKVNAKNRKQQAELASQMTDQELRERVNRLNMERQYVNLSTEQMNAGRSRVDSILATAGTAITVTNSALAIALAVKQLTS